LDPKDRRPLGHEARSGVTIASRPMSLPIDGRQSQMALEIARGLRRHLRRRGFASVTEMALPSGRRADVVALAPDGAFSIFEIKSSIADFRSDAKWRDYRLHCDRLYFAVSADFPDVVLPPDVGFAVADAYGAELVREAPEHKLAPAARKSMLVRFGVAAADRLHTLFDPEIGD
jgi:hypothetical protein